MEDPSHTHARSAVRLLLRLAHGRHLHYDCCVHKRKWVYLRGSNRSVYPEGGPGFHFPNAYDDEAFNISDSPPIVPRLEGRGGELIRLESVIPRAHDDQVRLEVLEVEADTE